MLHKEKSTIVLAITRPDGMNTQPVRLLTIHVNDGQRTYDLGAESAYWEHGKDDSSVIMMHMISPFVASDTGAPDMGATTADIVRMLEKVVARDDGSGILMDLIDDANGKALPNCVIHGIVVSKASDERDWPKDWPAVRTLLNENDQPIVTEPAVPHMHIKKWEYAAVSTRMSALIKEAILAYLNLVTNNGWPIEDFITEYIMSRGAWADLNASTTNAAKPDDIVAIDD